MGKYVLANNNGEYLVFEDGKSPAKVNKICEATEFKNRIKAVNRIKTIPKKLGKDWHPEIAYEYKTREEAIDMNEVYEQIEEQLELFKNVVYNEQQLWTSLSVLSLMEEDLKHLIEINEFNVVDGYMSYKLFHEVRVKRREVKNQLESINNLKNSKVNDLINGDIKENLGLTQKKVYAPRTCTMRPLFNETHLTKDLVNTVCKNIRRIA